MKTKLSIFFQVILFIFPWRIRRIILSLVFKYDIHPSARIGFSIILAQKLTIGKKAIIGNLSFCNAIDVLHIDDYSIVGNLIYITGYPSSLGKHFSHIDNRSCSLIVDKHSAITGRHFIDCTAGVKVGRYTTIAGIRSQLLTHSINLEKNIQDCGGIIIGDYCFLGTNCVLLPGSNLPSYSILGAKSLLNKSFSSTHKLYGGVPSRELKSLEKDSVKYFSRENGFVI